MIQQTFNISNIIESQNSSGDNYVSSVTWVLTYSDNMSFSKTFSKNISFNEGNCPESNLNDEILNFIIPYIDFSYYSNKAKSLYVQETYETSFRWYIYELLTIPNFEGVSNFVTRISWRLYAETNLGVNCSFENYTFFNKLNNSNYINYNDLKEQDVISWLETNEDYVALKDKLCACIFEKINPPVVSLPLPW